MSEIPEGYIVVPASDWREIVQYELKCQELAAQVGALRGAAQKLLFEIACCTSPTVFDSFSGLQDAIAATPQQHLAEIRAEAGRDGYIAACLTHLDEPMDWVERHANQYVDSIRQEKK